MQMTASNGKRTKAFLELVVALRKVLSTFKLKLVHYHILVLLQEKPGTTPKQITEALGTLPAAVTRYISYLENRELIQRSFCTDRRTVPCSLTQKGHELLEKVTKRVAPLLEEKWNDYNE